MSNYHKKKQFATLIGVILLHTIIATIHTWSSVTRYFYSYLVEFSGSTVRYTYLEIIISLLTAIHTISLPIGVLLTKKYSPNVIIGLGLILVMIAKAFYVLFPRVDVVTIANFCCGIGSGLAYMPSIIILWKYFPTRKGLMTGYALTGFGLNRLFFKYISNKMINPQGIGLVIGREKYPKEIDENFKIYLEKSVVFFAILSVVCTILIYPYDGSRKKVVKKESNDSSRGCVSYNPTADDVYVSFTDSTYNSFYSFLRAEDENNKNQEPLCSLIGSYPYLQLTFIFFFAMVFGTIELSSMKKLGLMNGHTENFLWLTALIWKIVSVGSFMIWGALLDCFGFKKVYTKLLLVQIGISSTAYFLVESEVGFFVYNLISAAVGSGNLVFSHCCFSLVFGSDTGGLLYSISALLINTFYISRVLIANIVTVKIYFLIFYLVITLFSMLSMIILCFFVEKKHTYTKEKKESIELKTYN